ncbi:MULTISPECIES: prephenate dehydratase [Prevotella]|uniref:prephenate dehydratase n=1 Tax=Prevotella herbatica TaxID=2801997 RepID=A0ABN6EEC1_9BACT|nr:MULTISPECIES: prephenate dehydratase [Prevotella]MDN5554703.1 prephenate dehydratase [Prevotella sp.]BCS84273.1 prephenate dehydratase [Prevotella herbatica]
MKRIAIQGEIGSFHDIAAHQYFNDEQIELICCSTFEQVFENIKNDPTVIGIIAIENTIAGSLLHNYDLLRESGVTVVGEHKLHIEHSICCLPDDNWDTVTEVHSHPVALAQCRNFLENHPEIKAVEAEDTAGSAEYISSHNIHGWAAICSSHAANIYGMKLLQEDIHDNKHNYTRFLVVSNPHKAALLREVEKSNKSSLVFSLSHEEGSLSKVLTILSFYDINLTKIQSLPIIGHEWEYLFYVDVSFDNLTRYRQSIDAITPLVKNIKILGEYETC